MHAAKHWHRSPRVCGRFCGPWSPGCICSLRGWGPGSILVGGSLRRRNARSGPVGTSRAWQRVWPWPPRSAPGVDVDSQAGDALGAAGPHEPDKEASASYRRMARAENLGVRGGLNGAFLCPFDPPPSLHLCAQGPGCWGLTALLPVGQRQHEEVAAFCADCRVPVWGGQAGPRAQTLHTYMEASLGAAASAPFASGPRGAGIWLRLSITSVCVCAISWVTELTRELMMEFVFVHCKYHNFRTSCIKYEKCIYNGACVLP